MAWDVASVPSLESMCVKHKPQSPVPLHIAAAFRSNRGSAVRLFLPLPADKPSWKLASFKVFIIHAIQTQFSSYIWGVFIYNFQLFFIQGYFFSSGRDGTSLYS